jgi:hypothetical protein
MTAKHRWLWASILLLLLVIGPLVPWGYYAAAGLVRGEHSYHGLPSSYWSRQVRNLYARVFPLRPPDSWDRVRERWYGGVPGDIVNSCG